MCNEIHPLLRQRYTPDDVALILSHVLERQTSLREDRQVYTVEQVADLTHFSKRALQKLMSNDQIRHVRMGRSFGLTPEQLGELIRTYSTGGVVRNSLVDPVATPVRTTEMERAREMSRRAIRPSRRRA